MDQQSEKIYQYINPKSQTFFPIFGRAADRPPNIPYSAYCASV